MAIMWVEDRGAAPAPSVCFDFAVVLAALKHAARRYAVAFGHA
jgi:hypothetical protein